MAFHKIGLCHFAGDISDKYCLNKVFDITKLIFIHILSYVMYVLVTIIDESFLKIWLKIFGIF